VLAINGAYKFLRSRGIDPEHFLLIDSRPENITHVDSPYAETNHCLASQVHPRVFDALSDHQITLFHLGTEATYEALKGTGEHTFSSGPIGMASIHAIYLAAALGYRTLFLFGYDFSHKAGETYAFDQPMNRGDAAFEVTLNGVKYSTTLALARTAEQFGKAITPIIKACDLDVRMFSSGLLPEMLKVAMNPATVESERDKYEQMWELGVYRTVSPGFDCVAEALTRLAPFDEATIADFGCGTGRAVRWLLDRGFDAVGVDIAPSALEENVPFVQCALWEAEKLPRVDYAICTDVLEHIPTERVRDTLKAIHGAVGRGCYLNIDTIPDSMGVNIGKTLHMTVMPSEQWEALLKELWPHVESYPQERQAVFVCRK
jgi:2-polyprenyl-3-methyl-5-hydroxy-6-metoxy-1,4-benzoquinol methylase